jgi:hypothetical protein
MMPSAPLATRSDASHNVSPISVALRYVPAAPHSGLPFALVSFSFNPCTHTTCSHRISHVISTYADIMKMLELLLYLPCLPFSAFLGDNAFPS